MAWIRENTWIQRGATMLDTLLGVLDTKNTWFQLGTIMLDTPWVAWTREKHAVPARDHHVRDPLPPWVAGTCENTYCEGCNRAT